MKIFNNKRILIISSESWEHDFLSKHHYAIELGKIGNEIFFLNPPGKLNRCSRPPFTHVSVIDYKPVVKGLNYFPVTIANLFYKKDIDRIEKLAGGKFDIIWSFDPYRFQDISTFKASFSLYFAADMHADKKSEKKLSDSAQLVLAPSQLILDTIQTKTPKVKINHAVADYFLVPNLQVTSTNARIKIGYVGNLDSKYLDFELLKQVVEMNAGCDFIFIGGQTNNPKLSLPANARFVGRKENREVPALLNSCDVLLLCYNTTLFWKEASNSHKIMEYLSTGKVVVSTRIAEYIDKPLLVVMPDQNNELPKLINQVCSKITDYNAPEKQNIRIEYAKQNSYENQLKKIDTALTQATEK